MDVVDTPKQNVNYAEIMKKNSYHATSSFTQKFNAYFRHQILEDGNKHLKPEGFNEGSSSQFFPSHPLKVELEASELSTVLERWHVAAKVSKPYNVELKRFGPDTKLSGIMVAFNCVIKAGISFKYEEANGSTVLMIARLAIFGYHEKKTIHQSSDIILFQRITQIATNTLHEFDQESLIPDLLNWLSNYHDIFTAKCQKCQKHLVFQNAEDKFLPPTLRVSSSKDGGQIMAFHRACVSDVMLLEEM